MLLKSHLDMIGRNEPIQRKARFWQSYVRALKGTDDMRAPEQSHRTPRSIFRPLFAEFPEVASKLDSWPYSKSIYDDQSAIPHERISSPGYRYQPISRDTYGYAPRSNLYRDTYRPDDKLDRAWEDHLDRLAEIEKPMKYPYSKRYSSEPPESLLPIYERPARYAYSPARYVSPPNYVTPPARYVSPVRRSLPKDLDTYKSKSVEPISDKALAYTYSGLPIYTRGGYLRRPLSELLNPSIYTSPSSIIRDPWWWAYPHLRPYESPYVWRQSPSYLRDSYLSPVKRTYLWGHHPIRPFGNPW